MCLAARMRTRVGELVGGRSGRSWQRFEDAARRCWIALADDDGLGRPAVGRGVRDLTTVAFGVQCGVAGCRPRYGRGVAYPGGDDASPAPVRGSIWSGE